MRWEGGEGSEGRLLQWATGAQSCRAPSNDPQRTHLSINLQWQEVTHPLSCPMWEATQYVVHIRKLVGPWKSPSLPLLCQRGT